ncbi:MOSC domain-containing protein [Falsiphaeobacter marinintestinus]|uniref:MOSC domain-containing protein n=1 Tax=Falsiphaeobacter marinintestinus TaxID=1492905 RepID=UPI0011B506A1|nr:MOSC domain-containing protein [Phaeobacter marinintestinus]
MPALRPTDYKATIRYLGVVEDRDATLASAPVETMELTFAGLANEEHAGLTRPSCSRVLSQHPRNTEIANVRQLSVLSAEELAAIRDEMGLGFFDPTWVGASLVIEGIPDFTHVPPSSRLQAPSGATLVIDMENRPCVLPAKVIDAAEPGMGKLFKTAAKSRRGVTAWVEREGVINLGDDLQLHIPDQPVWTHLDAARSRN